MKIKFIALLLMTVFMNTGMQANANDDIFKPVEFSEVPSGMAYNVSLPPAKDHREFKGKKIGILVSHGVQEIELTFPYQYLKDRGASIEIIVPDWISGRVLMVDYVRPTTWARVDKTISQASIKDYDLLLVAGGAWSSTVVRQDLAMLKFINDFYSKGGDLAVICSGSQVLIDAGIAKNTELTGSHSIRIDLENAGAKYIDKEVVVSGHLITSRSPEDLPAFVNAIGNSLRAQ